MPGKTLKFDAICLPSPVSRQCRLRTAFSVREGDEVTTYAIRSVTKNSSTPTVARLACIDSWRINAPSEAWVIDRVVQDALDGRGGTVFTINLDHLAKLRRDPAFRAAYERASYVTADGMPVVLLARSEGVEIDRVTGADLVVPLARAAAEAGISIHFFGSRIEVLERAVARLRVEVPDLAVAGIEAPPMGFDPCGEEAEAAARRIAASGAGICFVALGAPKQELFANAALTAADGVVYLGVGAALDFLAGERSRAPRLFQRLGLEWVWRVAQEPRRLLPRYAVSALWLVGYVVRLALGQTRAVAVSVDLPIEPRPVAPRTAPSGSGSTPVSGSPKEIPR